MKVLVLETMAEAADGAVEALVAAGHEVVRCHEPGEHHAFPCVGLVGATPACAVTEHAVDVALTVRSNPRSQPAPLEDGVSCALRHHIPLVVAGRTALHPFEDFATVVVHDGNVVEGCERAATAPLRRHSEVARQAWDRTLSTRGIPTGASTVAVTRQQGGLLVSVESDTPVERSTVDMASARMLAAVREIDTVSRAVDVRVVQTRS